MNATILNLRTVNAAAPISSARLLNAYLTEAKYEALRMLRAPGFAIPFLLLPVLVYLLFGVVIAGNDPKVTPGIHNALFIGFAVMAAIGPGFFGVGMALALERDAGVLKLKRALPVPTGAYLLAKLLMSLFFAALAMVLMIGTALIAGKITLDAGTLAAIAATLIVGALPFCAMGLLIGAYFSGGVAPAILNVIYLPMLWLSGLFIPLPVFLQKWALIWPAFYLQQLTLAAAGLKSIAKYPPAMAVVVLLAVTLLCASLAIRKLAIEARNQGLADRLRRARRDARRANAFPRACVVCHW